MRILFCILIVLLSFYRLIAQNLVPNPSFEFSVSCNESFTHSTLENAQYWFNAVHPLTSVDWYSNCFCSIPGTDYCPPSLNYGHSFPHAGLSMIGFGPYSDITKLGESAGIRLNQPMIQDSAYCLNFWIKNSKHHGEIYSLRKFDIAFVTDTTSVDSKSDITNFITVENSDDNGEWRNISTYYIASGGEEYLLIGSFAPNPEFYFDPNTDPTYRFVYYYYDDFVLEQCSKDSLLSVVLDLPNVLTLNDNAINEQYLIRKNNIKSLDLQVFNRWGNLVREYDGINEVWDGNDDQGNPLTAGAYFVKAVAETTFGDLVHKSQYVHLIRP